MWVVKLGGSLQSFPGLRDWVRLIAEQGGGRVVLVPGGGQFADAVRAAQRTAGFDDRTAHGMALFAMEQYGLMLAALAPRYCNMRKTTIYAGSNEIQRNIIAKHALGL